MLAGVIKVRFVRWEWERMGGNAVVKGCAKLKVGVFIWVDSMVGLAFGGLENKVGMNGK